MLSQGSYLLDPPHAFQDRSRVGKLAHLSWLFPLSLPVSV